MSPCSLKGGFIPRTCRSSAGGGVPSIAFLSLPLSPGSAEHKQPSPGDLRMRLDRVGLGSAGRVLLLIEYAWSGLPGAVSDEGRMKMLMFVKLSEASLYLPCVARGIICCRVHVILHLIAPKRLKVAGFSLNFSTDVASCCSPMIPMNTRFLPARCRRAALFPPKIVCLVQMLQFHTTISHSVTRNLGRTS